MPFPAKMPRINRSESSAPPASVDDLPATVERLLSLGVTEYQSITKRGEGFVTASVVDPFGNVLGVMYNQHYLAVAGG